MFEKVLIAEDFESTSISVKQTLEDLGIKELERTYYCDDALLRIKKELEANRPFDLLITDLSFVEDHRAQKISGGAELIRAVKQTQPNLKVIVFSVENRAAMANYLVKELDIDGYVPKARNDAKDLKVAIETIYKNKKFLSQNLKYISREENHHDFTALDKEIIFLLAEGYSQKKISMLLKEKAIEPNSLSSIEKRLNVIKTVLNFSKNEQLIAYCKDRYPYFFQ